MPVFKCFWKIMLKHKLMLLMYFIIFMAITIMYSQIGADSDSQTNFSATEVNLAVIDRDGSTISAALTDYLDGLHHLVDLADEETAMQDALFFHEVDYILIIPSDFEKGFSAGNEDIHLENIKVPNSTSGVYIDNQIDSFLLTLQTYLHAEFDLDTAIAQTEQDLSHRVTVEVAVVGTEINASSPFYFQYLPYIFLSMMISALGPVFLAFNKTDVTRRIECSAFTWKERNFQLALGCVISSVVIWLAFMVIAFLLFGEEMTGSIGALRMLNSFVFLIVSVGIAFLLGQLMKSTSVLSAATNVIGLGMSFLTGVFVPQEFLSSGVLSVARFLPSYWYVRSNDMLTTVSAVTNESLRTFLEGIGIQFGFALVIFAIAFAISRRKKLKPSA